MKKYLIPFLTIALNLGIMNSVSSDIKPKREVDSIENKIKDPSILLPLPKRRRINLELISQTPNNKEQKKVNFEEAYKYNDEDLKKYNDWIKRTIAHSKRKKDFAIIVDKAAYELQLYKDGALFTTMPIELSSINTIDEKIREWDGKTPEGMYEAITVKGPKRRFKSSFYKAFLINYPNRKDKKRFNQLKKEGKIPKDITNPGGAIEIHGGGSGLGRNGNDWTIGCIAMSNEQMDQLFKYVKKGNKITIVRYGTKDLDFYQKLYKSKL
jgi:hypothetical protein